MDRPIVLVVEDDLDALVLTTSLLTAEGFPVLSAVDVPQALELASLYRPGLILLDHELPAIPGLSAVDRLRGALHAPIVVVSAHGFRPTDLDAVDGYVQKPWEPDRLLAAIDDALELHADDRAVRM